VKIASESITNQNAARIVAEGKAAIGAGDLLVDFSAVTRCDTSAVACVLAWLRIAQAGGKRLQLVSLPKDLLSLAKLYGVEQLVAGG
jgi:phospholipid transport system transporter-binding protein